MTEKKLLDDAAMVLDDARLMMRKMREMILSARTEVEWQLNEGLISADSADAILTRLTLGITEPVQDPLPFRK